MGRISKTTHNSILCDNCTLKLRNLGLERPTKQITNYTLIKNGRPLTISFNSNIVKTEKIIYGIGRPMIK